MNKTCRYILFFSAALSAFGLSVFLTYLFSFRTVDIARTECRLNTVEIEKPPAPSPIRTIERLPAIPTDFENQGLYFGLLNKIIEENYAGGMQSADPLVYRKETISPLGIDQIENNPNISKSLLDGFKAANKKTEILSGEYVVPAAIRAYSGERDLIKFYKTVNRKGPGAAMVVAFSNFGIDESRFVSLIYVEAYWPGKGLTKFYYRMDALNSKYDKIPVE